MLMVEVLYHACERSTIPDASAQVLPIPLCLPSSVSLTAEWSQRALSLSSAAPWSNEKVGL